jgi:hypothetical protein
LENIVITWRELLLVGLLVLGVYIAEMLLLLKARGSERHRPMLGVFHKNRAEPELKQELLQLASRVQVLEAQLAELMTEQAGEESNPYQRAIQLARQGRDAGRISQSCGISHGEAELIVSMHGPHAS